jgi:glycerol-3-phosphate O-acyltransferase
VDPRNKTPEIFEPDWLKSYIVLPCMNVHDLVNTAEAKTRQIFVENYIGTRLMLMKRVKESILNKLTSSIIDIIEAFGYPPDTTAENENMNEINYHLQQMNSSGNESFEQNLYTLFFAAIPHIIESNVEKHSDLIFRTSID